MDVVEKFNALMGIINDAGELLKQLQSECSHPNYIAKYDGYSCSYDGDAYWVTIDCPDCGYRKLHDPTKPNGERDEMYYADHPRREYARRYDS